MTGQQRVALVTGAGRTRGIAAAIARRLAADGWDLGLNFWDDYDRRVHGETSDAHRLAEEIGRVPSRRVVLLPGDLSDPAVAYGVMGELRELLGPVGALVMSHSEGVPSDLIGTTVESFDRHYAVNVRATWLLVKAFAEQVEGGGAIVALTSDHTAFNLPYGATKGALDRVVLAATHELGHLDVRANVVNPGPIDTGWMDEETRAAGADATPGGRLGDPGTTADLVGFLLSQEGRWINGQLLLSNGGFKTPAV